jgi:hypothetical protein
MCSWLKNRKTSDPARSSRDALLNEGLDLAMAWGEDWLKPIQERLALLHPELSPGELDEVNAICQAAMKFGHDCVEDLALKSMNNRPEDFGKNTTREDFEPLMKARYPWVDPGNLSHLFNQGMYYAWKNL